MATRPEAAVAAAELKQFFGHPIGLATLFFTELWERFSYYGMRALLILFLTAPIAAGGLAFGVVKACAIYGLYTSMVYLLTLPGGWVADRLIGHRKAVLIGGIIIAMGHFSLAFPSMVTFYLGLGLIVTGTGLLKANISVMVGQLYTQEDARRDSGFTIFYMGINIGAFIAPFVTSTLGEKINWHYGFAAAGVGMVIGLIIYLAGGKYLGDVGRHPTRPDDPQKWDRQKRHLRLGVLGLLGAAFVVALAQIFGVIHITALGVANAFGVVLLLICVVFFSWLFLSADWTPVERKRLIVIGVLFLAAALFWSAFEQAGSTLNLFAEGSTNRSVLGFEFPAGWFQSLNPVLIILLAPVFAWLWIWLARRKKEPSSPAKFSWGLVLVGAGFLVMIGAAAVAAGGVRVSPMWLFLTYLLHTLGELCLSPVGLSTVTKLAPARVTGLMMGVWFLAAAVGNYGGGRVAGFYEALPLPVLFLAVASTTVVAGLLLALLVKPIRQLMGGVH